MNRVPRTLLGLAVLALVAVWSGIVPTTAAADDAYAARYEVSLGVGGARAFEDDLFNVPSDSGSEPQVFVDFRFRQNLRGPWSVGFQVFGTAEETAPYAVSAGTGLTEVRFDVALAHLGAHVRYRLTESRLRPYFEAGANYVSGSVDQSSLGHLNLNGVSVHGGAGLQFLLTRSAALELSGVFATGTAKWERAPFGNSTSKDYDPSLAAVAGSFCWRWGH